MGRPAKKKLFKYFTGHDDILPKKAVEDAAKKFGISKSVAKRHYNNWRKLYMDSDIQRNNYCPCDKDKNGIA